MTTTLESPTQAAPKSRKAKASTLPKRMDAMEEGYGIKYLGDNSFDVDLWRVGLVITKGKHTGEFDPAHAYTVAAIGPNPKHCPCRSSEKPCKHARFLYRHLNQDAQRGPCPECAAQQRGGVLFSECRDFAGGSLYYWVCDVCGYERALV